MWVRPDSHARCAVVAGHAQVTSCLTKQCLVNLSMSRRSRHVPRIPVSIDFPSTLNRGRKRVFRPNLSPFLSCCISSLNMGREGVLVPIPSPIPELPLLLLLPFHRARSYVVAVSK